MAQTAVNTKPGADRQQLGNILNLRSLQDSPQLFEDKRTMDDAPGIQPAKEIVEAREPMLHYLTDSALRHFNDLDSNKNGSLSWQELQEAKLNTKLPELTLSSADFLAQRYSRYSAGGIGEGTGYESSGYTRSDLNALNMLSAANAYKPVSSIMDREGTTFSGHAGSIAMAAGIAAGILCVLDKRIGMAAAVGIPVFATGLYMVSNAIGRRSQLNHWKAGFEMDSALDQHSLKYRLIDQGARH